jgi:hypothetical protein
MTALVLDACPGCGTATDPRLVEGHVHASFCLACTEDDLGETLEQIRQRTAAVSRKAAQRVFQGKAK